MTPTKYALLIENGNIYLRGYAAECQRGYFNVEAVRLNTGKSIVALRRVGAQLAKRFNVPFEDRT